MSTPRPGTATDVVVVGAGPVGLLLAHDLRTHGVDVVVVEQLEEPTGQSRASTLHARTMELLAERDLLAPLGPPTSSGGGHFAGLPLDVSAADPDHPFAGVWKAPQTRIEQVLAERVVSAGVRVLRGHRLTGVVHDGNDGMQVETAVSTGGTASLRAAYLVGCDGEHSVVRRLCGFDLAGEAGHRELLRADVTGVDLPNRRFERHPNGVAISSRGPDGVTRVMLHEYGCDPRDRTADPDFAEVAARWRRITGDDIGAGTPVWVEAFDDTCRQVTRYRRGRVLLAGDAAHQQLPVGGQAINLGLQDAAALGAALAAQFTGPPDERLLERYHEVRHAIGARALTSIAAQALLLFGGPRTDAARAVVAELLDLAPVRRAVAGVISGLRPAPHHAGAPARAVPSPVDTRTDMTLLGKNALVTGGSRGIGRATALRLGRKGALVAVHFGHDRTAADEVVEAVERDGGSAFAVRAELGVPGDVHELFLGLEAGLKERTGGTDLHIVVNNAGVMGGVAPEDVVPETFDRLFAINARAPFFIVQRALSLMPDGGRIINISSGLTRVANPQETAYAMTKGAIDQLTLHLAKHLGPRGITVNSVGPGITDNGSAVFSVPEAVDQMAQLSVFGRVGTTEEIASVVAFLASDDASWITGSYLDASGGTLLGG